MTLPRTHTKFFVEIPDKDGRRSFTNSHPAVLELDLSGSTDQAIIVAPEFHAEKFKMIPKRDLLRWYLEVPGPAREMTNDELNSLTINELLRLIAELNHRMQKT